MHHKIVVVNRVPQHCAALLTGPCAAPGNRIIIFPSRPMCFDGADLGSAGYAGVYQCAQVSQRRPPVVFKYRDNLTLMADRRSPDPIHICHVCGHRFFAIHMFSCLKRSQCCGGIKMRRQANIDQVNFGIVQCSVSCRLAAVGVSAADLFDTCTVLVDNHLD